MTQVSPAPLNELELDALTELVNLGVSKAAESLREMVGEQVHLSVPGVALIGRARAVEILKQSEAKTLVAVHQVFEGDIIGRALLIFPEAKSLELVRAVTNSDLTLDEIIDLEQEALAEMGAKTGPLRKTGPVVSITAMTTDARFEAPQASVT